MYDSRSATGLEAAATFTEVFIGQAAIAESG